MTHIFVTHTHRDHSPAVPAVKAATGATVLAEGPHRAARPLHIGEAKRLDASADMEFAPDRALADGEVVSGKDWAIEAVATPGHTANHMAYALKGKDILFAGDHVMAWATSIVAPPDGAMSDYMASLHKLARRSEKTYFPGHGGPVRDAPTFVRNTSAIGEAREASILHRLGKGEADIPSLVRAIYIGLDPRLAGAAGLSTLAHLEDLVARGQVATAGPPSIAGTYRLVGLSFLDRRLGRLLRFLQRLFGLVRRGRVVDVLDQARDARGVGRRNRASRSATPIAHRRASGCRSRARGSPRRREIP